MRKALILFVLLALLNGCVTMRTAHQPRLLVTVMASKTEITPLDSVALTLRAENIGDVPIDIPSKVTKSGICTFDWGAGEWGLMSPDYCFGPSGAVSVESFAGFRLQPGESHTLHAELKLNSPDYRFRTGIYFADARFRDQTLARKMRLKIVPVIVRLSEKP